MNLSIVTTLYSSAPYIEEFYRRIKKTVERITDDYEIIFVNDCSPDNSVNIAISLYEKDRRVKVVDFSRNYGQYKAIMTGLSFAAGDLIFLIDSDLEEEPELLERFHEELINDKEADVVYGIQQSRKGSLYERATGAVFYKLINFLSNWEIPANLSTVRLMRKYYVTNLIRHRDQEIFLAGLWAITGFNQKPIVINKHGKKSTTYNTKKKISILVNAITSFSNKPLIYIFYTGFIIMFLALSYILLLIVQKLFFQLPVHGYASIIVSIWFLGGLIIVMLGIVGIYISKIFIETKDRPYTVIKAVYERETT